MNAPISRLFVLVVLLFGLLVVFTSRWTVFEAEALRDMTQFNRRALLEEAKVDRGTLRARDRSALARSVPGPEGTFVRRYPGGALFGHAIGYSDLTFGRAGLEQSLNDALAGRASEADQLLQQLGGRVREGDDVITSLDPRGQKVAQQALAGKRGGIVALRPSTGEVLVMASSPRFDPGELETARDFAALNRAEGSPLLNRATQARYPPGSTFKVVTAAAALDSGRFKPDSRVSGKNAKEISGVPLNNFGDQDFGEITLTQALTQSVNTVWAEVAETLGRGTMTRYMERFGFYEQPPLDYPEQQIAPSGVRGRRGLVPPTSERVDLGRMAIGQERLTVTPLQMAMVAAAVANGGVLMRPHFTRRVVDPDGRVVEDVEPERLGRVIKRESAAALTAMMRNVVREGSGTAAALQGIEVAGKTGTAELDVERRINQPWFIGFVDDVAVAVTFEAPGLPPGAQGGTFAAPVAKAVLEALR